MSVSVTYMHEYAYDELDEGAAADATAQYDLRIPQRELTGAVGGGRKEGRGIVHAKGNSTWVSFSSSEEGNTINAMYISYQSTI